MARTLASVLASARRFADKRGVPVRVLQAPDGSFTMTRYLTAWLHYEEVATVYPSADAHKED